MGVFDDIEEQAFKSVDPSKKQTYRGNPFAQIEDEASAPLAPPTAAESGSKNVSGFLRNANNMMTLGLWDKIVGMMPGTSIANEEAKTQAYKKEHPYATVAAETLGGIGPQVLASNLIGKAVPALAKYTIPRIMAKEGLATGGVSVASDLAHGEKPDVAKAGIAGAQSALLAGPLAAIVRGFSPSAKFRNSGIDLTDADKSAAAALMDKGQNVGARLSIPEALREVSPNNAARVQAGYNSNSRLPEGSIQRSNFDASRYTGFERVVENIKNMFGGGPAEGSAISKAGKKALDEAESLINSSAKPYMDKAKGDIVPALPKSAARRIAEKATLGDEIKMAELGGKQNVRRAGIPFLDHVKGTLGEMYEDAVKAQSRNAGIIARDKNQLNSVMTQASPNYGIYTDIQSNGRTQLLDPLRAGPTGAVAKAGASPKTQAGAIFDVNSPAGADASINALKRLEAVDPAAPRSLLATRIDSAAENPINFASRLASTKDAQRVVEQVVGPNNKMFGDMSQVMRARDPIMPRPYAVENSDGPGTKIWDFFQNFGSGKTTNMYHDPANLSKLGVMGPVQQGAHSTIGSIAQQTAPNIEAGFQPVIDKILPEILLVDSVMRRRKRQGG